jgi:acetyl-CoA carboxylase alpha subunit
MKARVRDAVLRHVARLSALDPEELVRRRREKYLAIGVTGEDPAALTPPEKA